MPLSGLGSNEVACATGVEATLPQVVTITTKSPTLVALLCALGAAAGAATGVGLTRVMGWARGRFSSRASHRAIRTLYVLPPLIVLAVATDVLGDGPDLVAFIVVMLAGYFGMAVRILGPPWRGRH
jgi:hypothetical protein